MAASRRQPLSGCVIAFMEEDRIADCLRSLAFCDEVVVVDSGSTDRTVEICRAMGARVVHNSPFPGFAAQRQFAVDQARHDWVVCLDADERVEPDLADLLRTRAAAGSLQGGYRVCRKSRYLGRTMRHGLFWPDRKLRIFDRRLARVVANPPHDHVAMQTGAPVEDLEGALLHLNYRTLRDHLRTIDSYASQAAAAMRAAGRKATPLDLLARPVAVLAKSLVFKLGLLDGWRGLLAGTLAAYYDWLKYWRLLWRRGNAA